MNKINWENSPSTRTPLNADNLNRMQDNIEEAMEMKIITGEEFVTNEYVDGKRIYGKVIFFDSLPANSTRYVATGLDMLSIEIYELYGIARNNSNGETYPIPYATAFENPLVINLGINNDGFIVISDNADFSRFKAKVILKYIKINE